MISLRVENRKIYTNLVSDPKVRIDIETMEGITALLAEFEVQLIRWGYPRHQAIAHGQMFS